MSRICKRFTRILAGAVRGRAYGVALMLVLAACCGTVAAADEIARGTPTFGISNHTAIIWRSAQIDGDRIVWAESITNTGFVYNIYLYNITTGKETLVSPSSPDEPQNDYMGDENPVAISGNRIVWTKHGDVWMFDITTGKRTVLALDRGEYGTGIRRSDPDISGDIVIWRQQEITVQNFRNPDIIAYNITSQKQTTVSHGNWDKSHARISGSGSSGKIIGTATPIFTSTISQLVRSSLSATLPVPVRTKDLR